MEELKKQWSERADAADKTGSEHYNFWAVMANHAPLSNTQIDTFRAFILQDMAKEAAALVIIAERLGEKIGMKLNTSAIKETLDQYQAISDMLNWPHISKPPTVHPATSID